MSSSSAFFRPIVLLTDPLSPVVLDRLNAIAETHMVHPSAPEFADVLQRAHAIIVRSQLDDNVFDAAPNMLIAIRHGVGIDMIPLDNATHNHVAVSAVPGGNRAAVAEYAVAQMIAFNRRLADIEKLLRNEGWAAARSLTSSGLEFGDKTVGIVGLGAIGETLARICHFGFGSEVWGNRRNLDETPQFVVPKSMEEVFSGADFVVIACPLTEKTRGMIDARLLSLMKPGAVLVNLARGAIVNTRDLVTALSTRAIRGAILDVFDPEPLPQDSPLYSLDSVVMTPHCSGISRESAVRLGMGSVDEIERIITGIEPKNFFNRSVWDGVAQKLKRVASEVNS